MTDVNELWKLARHLYMIYVRDDIEYNKMFEHLSMEKQRNWYNVAESASQCLEKRFTLEIKTMNARNRHRVMA